jgi:hypothetical protein
MGCQHKWRDMHHFEDDPDVPGQLLHYCPTGFKTCQLCGKHDVREEGEKSTCFKWGEP